MSNSNNIEAMAQEIRPLSAQVEALRLEKAAYDFATLSYLLDLAYKEALAFSDQPSRKITPMLITAIQ